MKKNIILGLLLTIIFLFSIDTETFCFPLKANPQRVISLGPSITEELYLLGAQDRLVGCTLYCKRPKEAETKEKVATVIEVNLEKVIMLRPDLVLATSLTDLKTVKKLRNLGIKVVVFPQAKNFTEVCKQFLELGRIVGREKEAEEIVSQAKMRVNIIQKEDKNLPKQKVFVQIGSKPLFTATRDSFINEFIELAGGINIAQNSKSGLYSREKVLKDNPEVIIIVTMGIVGEGEREIWKKYETLKAVKNNRIYIIDSYKLCSPTPVSFVEALEEIANILHPKEARIN
jgi:iron complex transport system substrate-binding protein